MSIFSFEKFITIHGTIRTQPGSGISIPMSFVSLRENVEHIGKHEREKLLHIDGLRVYIAENLCH